MLIPKKIKLLIGAILLSTSAFTVIGQISPSQLEAAVKAGIDPYFVESTDTVSKYGPRCITRDVLQDKNGDFWFATWHGIIKYDGKVFTNYTLKDGLIHFHVLSCYEDKKGNLWFGTARGGLYQFDYKSFKLFTTKDGLADNTVSSFAEDKKGNIWLGTDKGVCCYDGKTFTNFTIKDGLSSNNVSSIMQDKTGKLWFGFHSSKYMGEDGGVSCYDGKSFTSFTNKNGASFKSVTSLFEDKTGNIWIGRFDGLTRYDGQTFTEFLPNYLTYSITEDKKGNLWLTHSEPNTHYSNLPNQILYRYDGKTFTRIIEKYEPEDCQIFGKTVDKNGNVWFGTMKGVCRLDVSRINHPCTKNTCNHNLPLSEATLEHKKELAKSLTYFAE